MIDIKNIIKFADLPTRQKLFFYELCKSGIVVFDLNKVAHQKILMKMFNSVKKKTNIAADETYLLRQGKVNDHMLDALIVMQIIKHAINPD